MQGRGRSGSEPAQRPLRIGVMGPGRCSVNEARTAHAVGREIALGGAILICGGGGGVMEAAARGAHENGGIVVGVLPSDSESTANAYVDIPVVTGLGNARNAINVLTSHALIAISGGPGTLSEIALALKVGTPVVGLRTWEFTHSPREHVGSRVVRAHRPADAVRHAFRLARAKVAEIAADTDRAAGASDGSPGIDNR